MSSVTKMYDLVIIGGGTAGLASAISANDAGITSILILEKDEFLGGILLQCIHNGFGLHQFKEELTGPEYASRFETEIIKRHIEYKVNTMALEISPNKEVTFSNAIDGLTTVKAKAIICATGCSERTREAINIPGDRPSGVYTAGLAQKYLNIEGYMVGKKVFILGSGDIGLIMARRLTLEGAKVLGVAEIMPYSNGLNRNIVQCLHDFNIPLYLSHTVKQIIGEVKLEKIVLAKVDEKFNFIPNTEVIIDVDCLLLSVGLLPSNPLLEKLGVAIDPLTKGPIVDEKLQTSKAGIFACGNSLHVHDLVDYVSEEGRIAGKNAAIYLQEEVNEDHKLLIIPGEGISYVLPQKLNSKTNLITISFRVKKPLQNVYLSVFQGEKLIRKVKRPFLLPAEMERLEIRGYNNQENIIVEVTNG